MLIFPSIFISSVMLDYETCHKRTLVMQKDGTTNMSIICLGILHRNQVKFLSHLNTMIIVKIHSTPTGQI